MNTYSIIIPVYNTDKELFENCINSVISQNYSQLEIIIVNDGSDEKTTELCREISSRDNRIKLLEQKNSGVSTARNNGIDNATGDYIAFLDSDDTFSPGFFSEIERNNSNEDILIYGLCLVYPNKKIPQTLQEKTLCADDREQICEGILTHSNEIGKIRGLDSTACKIYRTEFLKKNNIHFNTQLRRHEDSIFCLNAFSHMNTARIVPFVGYNYIFNPKSICQRFDPKVFDDTKIAISEYTSYISRFFPNNKRMEKALDFKIADIIISDCTTRYFTNKDNPASLKKRKAEFVQFIKTNKQYRDAFIGLDAGFPFSFYSSCIKKNRIGLMFYVYAFVNGLIRLFTIR